MFGPELTLIIVVAIIAGVAGVVGIVKAVFSSSLWGRSPDHSDLTTRELKALVQSAVDEATRPLHAKIDRLEKRLEERDDASKQLTPRSES